MVNHVDFRSNTTKFHIINVFMKTMNILTINNGVVLIMILFQFQNGEIVLVYNLNKYSIKSIFLSIQIASSALSNGCNGEGYKTIDGGQNCYKLISKNPKSFDDAQQFCKDEGGNLVSIRDGFEQAYISLVKTGSTNPEWIGLKNVNKNYCFELFIKKLHLKDGSKFSWSDGSQNSYSNWISGFNPSVGQQNNCAFLENKYSFWNATSCSMKNDFICKVTQGSKEYF